MLPEEPFAHKVFLGCRLSLFLLHTQLFVLRVCQLLCKFYAFQPTISTCQFWHCFATAHLFYVKPITLDRCKLFEVVNKNTRVFVESLYFVEYGYIFLCVSMSLPILKLRPVITNLTADSLFVAYTSS